MVNDLYHKKFPPLACSLSRTKFFFAIRLARLLQGRRGVVDVKFYTIFVVT